MKKTPFILSRQDRERIVWQLMGKDNWEAVTEIPDWMAIFDDMPQRMRLVIDLRLQGYKNQEIAKMMGISEDGIRLSLSRAKRRLARGME
jgi:RNA polymerase sigma factor (sigma-70 family)